MDLAARIGPGAEIEESEEFDGSVLGRGLGPVAISSAADKVTVAVALAVAGVAFDLPGPEGHRQRPIERVDLGPLVDRQNDRPRGRAGGEPDDVGHPGYELGIAVERERLGPMRLEAAFRQIRRIVLGLAPIALANRRGGPTVGTETPRASKPMSLMSSGTLDCWGPPGDVGWADLLSI